MNRECSIKIINFPLPIASPELTEGSKLLVVARYACRFEIFCRHFLFSQPKSLKRVARVRKKESTNFTAN